MKQKVVIYLAGTIKKAHESAHETYWTEDEMASIQKELSEFDVSFLNPAYRTDDITDQRSVFGRDMVQVYSADAVFVDARDRRGLGVGAEMMWAKVHRRPLIVWAPKDTHYYKSQTTILDVTISDFIHPFVLGLADKVVETVDEGAAFLRTALNDPAVPIRGLEDIFAAMQYYKETQYSQDIPMQELLSANAHVHERFQTLLPI